MNEQIGLEIKVLAQSRSNEKTFNFFISITSEDFRRDLRRSFDISVAVKNVCHRYHLRKKYGELSKHDKHIFHFFQSI